MHASRSSGAMRRVGRGGRRQRGAALLTAMIIVTLVATLASSMVWQQWRAVQVEEAERARSQARWILSGALEFGRLIIKETTGKRNVATTLGDPWATPLAEARLSTFLAVDKANADDGPEAFLSGGIVDAQARYNLMRLTQGGDPAKVAAELEVFKRLCEIVGVDGSIAARIAAGLVGAASKGGDGAALMPKRLAELAWLGVDETTLAALGPHVMLLPSPATLVNANTASREVIAAVANVDVATADSLVQTRQRKPFADLPAIAAALKIETSALTGLDFKSSHFEVTSRLRLIDRVLTERSLIRREDNGVTTVLHRERIAGVESAGG